jgi:hypothetical protein
MSFAPEFLSMFRAESSTRRVGTLFHLRSDECSITGLGKQTATFTRTTMKSVRDANGRLIRIGRYVSPWSWYDKDGDGRFEAPALLMEGSSDNKALWSQDMSQTGTWQRNGSPTFQYQAARLGALTFDRITDSSTSVTQGVRQDFAASTFATLFSKPYSFWIIQGDVTPAGGHAFYLFDNTAGVSRGSIIVNWINGAPTLSSLTGNFAYVDAWGLSSIGRRAFRICVQPNGLTSLTNVHSIRFDVAAVANQTGDCYVGGFQVEQDSVIPSSYILTTSAVGTRSVDQLTYPALWGEVDISSYVRLIREPWMNASGGHNFSHFLWAQGSSGGQAQRYMAMLDASRSAAASQVSYDGSTQHQVIAQSTFATGTVGQSIEFASQLIDPLFKPNALLDVNGGLGMQSTTAIDFPFVSPHVMQNVLQVGDAPWGLGNSVHAPIEELILHRARLTMSQLREVF